MTWGEPDSEVWRKPRGNFLAVGMCLAAVAFFAILPAIAVKSTSTTSRSTWIIFVFGFGIALIAVVIAARSAARDNFPARPPGPYVKRYGPWLLAFISATLILAELIAIAVTYLGPEPSIIRYAASQVSALGEGLFPVVHKFAAQIHPPLTSEVLLKAQTITTVLLLAGLLCTVVFAAYVVAMPADEHHALRQATEHYRRSPRPGSAAAICFAAFGLLLAISAFYGWFEFDPPKQEFGIRSKCIIRAYCYVTDDLTLFVSALARTFVVCGFGAGAILMIRETIGSRPSGLEHGDP